MKRQIKFRIWDKNAKKFLSGKKVDQWFLDMEGKLRFAEFPMGNGDNAADSVFEPLENQDNFVVQQFTGFVDDNNKEIYEGDIIKTTQKYKQKIYERGDMYHKNPKITDEFTKVEIFEVVFGHVNNIDDFYCPRIMGWGLADKFKPNDSLMEIIEQTKEPYRDDSYFVETFKLVEVIGNIFENKELCQ